MDETVHLKTVLVGEETVVHGVLMRLLIPIRLTGITHGAVVMNVADERVTILSSLTEVCS